MRKSLLLRLSFSHLSMLSGFANAFGLCQHEGGVTVIGRLSQCSHASRSRGIENFYGWQTTVRHPGKGQIVINGRSLCDYGAKAGVPNETAPQKSRSAGCFRAGWLKKNFKSELAGLWHKPLLAHWDMKNVFPGWLYKAQILFLAKTLFTLSTGVKFF